MDDLRFSEPLYNITEAARTLDVPAATFQTWARGYVRRPSGKPAVPDLFIDRSLGRIQVPALLRAAGLRLVTLAEFYGIPADEDVEDVTWLEMVGQRG